MCAPRHRLVPRIAVCGVEDTNTLVYAKIKPRDTLKIGRLAANGMFSSVTCALQKLQAYAHLWTPPQHLPFGGHEGHTKVDFDANWVKSVYET